MANLYAGVDPMLTDVAIAYKNDQLIADIIFPIYRTKKQTGKHFVYDKTGFRIDSTLRAPGSRPNMVQSSISTGSTFYADDHSLEQLVPQEDVEQAETPESPLISATENLTDRLMLDKEYALAAYMSSTSNLTNNTTLSGSSRWNDYSNSDPFSDIETGKTSIHSKIFKKANTLILGKQVYDKLIHHPDLIERVKYTNVGVLNQQLLATLFDVDQVLVGRAGYETADEGQTSSLGYVWGKHAWLAYIAPRIEKKMITFGMTYTYKDMVVENEFLKREKSYLITAGSNYYDQKVVTVDAAYLIYTAID